MTETHADTTLEPPAASSTPAYGELARQGLWHNNPALVQGLGLCPLLAVTTNVANGIGLGLATLVVLLGSNTSVSLLRKFVPEHVRLPAFVMIIASYTTCVVLLMQAFAFELYQIMALFVQIIVTNCTILGRAETFASRQPVLPSIWDGLMMGLGFAGVLIALGAMRELIGAGTLLADMDLLLGPIAADWTLTLLPEYRGFLLALLPPGAFLGMGLLIAGWRWLNDRNPPVTLDSAARAERRVRVTGEIKPS